MRHQPGEQRTSVSPTDVETLVRRSPLPVLASFEKPWSRTLLPRLEQVAAAFAGRLRVVQVDVVAHPALATRFAIRVVPTLLLFKAGTLVAFFVGPVPHRCLVATVSAALGMRPTPRAAADGPGVRGGR